MKAEMKEKTMRMFLVSQKHIVYTEPLEICAGITVDVLYNPSNTVLNGRPEVWFRCSFNRWMHPGGVLPPQKMVKAENGSHLKATGLSFLRSCLLYYTFFVVFHTSHITCHPTLIHFFQFTSHPCIPMHFSLFPTHFYLSHSSFLCIHLFTSP
jgi:hypothetical protein